MKQYRSHLILALAAGSLVSFAAGAPAPRAVAAGGTIVAANPPPQRLQSNHPPLVLPSGYHLTVARNCTLSTFTRLASPTLVTPRIGHTAEVVSNSLYVIGGQGQVSPAPTEMNNIERAPIGEDGNLGSFAIVPDVTMTTPRSGHTSAVIGQGLYVVGGSHNLPLNSIERAQIQPGGTLSGFTNPGVSLVTGRFSHAMARSGNFMYVTGGINCWLVPGPTHGTFETKCEFLNSVEVAPIIGGNLLGQFVALAHTPLATARGGHTSAVIGNYLYVIGGKYRPDPMGTSVSLASVERVVINTDGTLGPFAIVPGVTLATRRGNHTMLINGNCLFVIGGLRIGGGEEAQYLTSIEKSDINSVTGDIGNFTVLPSASLVLPREAHSSTVVKTTGKQPGNFVYEIGGISYSWPAATVEQAPLL